MSSLRLQDRVSLCRFTFADGRRCRTPRSPHHPHFCSDPALTACIRRPCHPPFPKLSVLRVSAPSAIIVFLLFSPLAFHLFSQEPPSNHARPNPFRCNTYKPSRKC
jgi:hypothetical protein